MNKNDYYIGQNARSKKAFTIEEVAFYCKNISIDNNPIHYDPNYAAQTIFKECIVPGIMVSSLFGGILGSALPGHGTIHLGQISKFLAPVYVGEEVEAIITITNIREDKPIITFLTQIFKQDGQLAIEGEAVVKI